jgi:hypothetical protein
MMLMKKIFKKKLHVKGKKNIINILIGIFNGEGLSAFQKY